MTLPRTVDINRHTLGSAHSSISGARPRAAVCVVPEARAVAANTTLAKTAPRIGTRLHHTVRRTQSHSRTFSAELFQERHEYWKRSVCQKTASCACFGPVIFALCAAVWLEIFEPDWGAQSTRNFRARLGRTVDSQSLANTRRTQVLRQEISPRKVACAPRRSRRSYCSGRGCPCSSLRHGETHCSSL